MDYKGLQGRRNRQSRPGLPGFERKEAFNFSAKTAIAESPQMGASDLLKRSKFTDSNSEGDRESWPVIDYGCLEHISDPVEYFSTYRMLENAENELKRLKGESYLKLSEPHTRRDRQPRPGLPELEGNKTMFEFPGMAANVVETSSLLECSNCIEFSNSEGISQTKNFEILGLESKLVGNAESHDSEDDEEIDGLGKLISTYIELDDSRIANLVWKTLQINPIPVEKLRVPTSSRAPQDNFGTGQPSKIATGIARRKFDGISTLKRRMSLMHHQDGPFLPPNSDKWISEGCKQTDAACDKLKSNSKDFNDALEKSQSRKRGDQITDYKKLRPNDKDLIDEGIAKSRQENLETKLLDVDKITRQVDHSSASRCPFLSADIQDRLAEISNLKMCIFMENSSVGLQQVSTSDDSGDSSVGFSDDSGDSSVSKSRKMYSLSPVDIHPNISCPNTSDASIPKFLNGRKLVFEGKKQSLIAETVETDKYISDRNISEAPKRHQYSLLENTVLRLDGALNEIEVLSNGSDVNFNDEAGQTSASANCRPFESLIKSSSSKVYQHFGSPGTSAEAGRYRLGDTLQAEVNTVIPEPILEAGTAKDDSFRKETTLMNGHLEISRNSPKGKNMNGRDLEALEDLKNRKTRRKASSRRQNKGSSSLKRRSLAGAGTVWKSGVRRSTRIRVKPLQHWCGERFLYGRVHDSLATVIGVKKYETSPKDGRREVMKVKSYVSGKYADLVAQAAMY